MTIYGLYERNGNRAGFWVQHRTWNNMCARVQSIDGREDGALPGKAPLFGGAKVHAKCFDVRSGRPLPPTECLSDGGDRNFVLIAQPAWAHAVARYS